MRTNARDSAGWRGTVFERRHLEPSLIGDESARARSGCRETWASGVGEARHGALAHTAVDGRFAAKTLRSPRARAAESPTRARRETETLYITRSPGARL